MLHPALTAQAILSAARAGRYLAFADVAEANGAEWRRVRRQMGAHLKGVCALAMERGGPMISSVVVNRRHVATGAMEPETLAGFLAAARELGFTVEDAERFLRAQQAATHAFAASSVGLALGRAGPLFSGSPENPTMG
ncbi:hypothetical protein [Salinarimonas soli]|uniref:Uncharacterized protein n=1 Tax=Salinarimonas soli TaxID=1638099 RepID=A0A5B2VHD4_9HYPH|nr:hypothetical protein [Salinarimonas soli]KAA2237762.1 hypothetical protein F0L46_08790 [Salinarimonas soli]